MRNLILALGLSLTALSPAYAQEYTGRNLVDFCAGNKEGCELLISTSLRSMVFGAGSVQAQAKDVEGFLGCGILDAPRPAAAWAVYEQLERPQNANLLKRDYISAIQWAAMLAYPCP